MKIAIIVVLSAIFLLILLVYPLPIRLSLFADCLGLKTTYCFSICRIKLLCGTAYIESYRPYYQNTHNVFSNFDAMTTKDRAFVKQIVQYIGIRRLKMHINVGFADNAFLTSMVAGEISAIEGAVYALAKNFCPPCRVAVSVCPSFCQSAINANMSAIIELSIFDVIIARIIANHKYKEKNCGTKQN
jgi:hypothetical protein